MKRGLAKARALFLSLLLLALPGCGKESVDFAYEEVRYQVTGGIAGFDRSLRIAPSGAYRVLDGGSEVRSGRLSGAQLRELKRLLSEVDWAGLKPRYIDGTVVDSLHQTLSVRTANLEHLTTVGTQGDPPAPVAALLAFLDAVMRDAQA